MQLVKILLIVMTITSLLLTAGCSEEKEPAMQKEGTKTTAADVKKEAKELMATTKSYTLEQREAYEKELAKKFAEYDRKIFVLKEQLVDATEETRQKLQEQINMLLTKEGDLRNRAKGLKEASGKAWDDLKKGLDKASADLDEAFAKAMQKFIKKPSSDYY